MKINSVELMRSIRERISQEIKGMSWHEEKEYLNSRIVFFDALLRSGSGDYTAAREQLFQGESVKAIIPDIKNREITALDVHLQR